MNNKKVFIALALVVLLGVVGGTYAYFTSSTTLTNEFTTGIYATKIVETFESPDNWTPGTTTDKKVNVVNKGTVDVAVRAKIDEKWTSANGNVLPATRDGMQIAYYVIGRDWVLAEDGYYYYKNVLSSGETSSDFISSVTFNSGFTLKEGEDISCVKEEEDGKTSINCVNLTTGYAGAKYTMNITLETIQADRKWNYIAVNKLFYWGYGSTPLKTINDITLQTGVDETTTSTIVKVSNSIFEPEELEGLKGFQIWEDGEDYELGTLHTDDIVYQTNDYYYVNTEFSGPFIIVLNSFGELTPGVWIIIENNNYWLDMQVIATREDTYIIYQ